MLYRRGVRRLMGGETLVRSMSTEKGGVIRGFSRAELAGDKRAMCALVDPSKLQYLEQVGNPCEMLYAGTLTAESAREVRNRTITSIEIKGDDAVAHIGGTSGARDLRLRRRGGHWRILGV
jgi:hypothetical protein